MSKIVSVDVDTRAIELERRAEGGTQVLSSALPCLVTMLEGSAEIRRGTFADALRAARAEIVTWSAAGRRHHRLLKCGLRGSPTVVKRVFAPTPRAEKAKQIEVKPKSRETADDADRGLVQAKPALGGRARELAAGL